VRGPRTSDRRRAGVGPQREQADVVEREIDDLARAQPRSRPARAAHALLDRALEHAAHHGGRRERARQQRVAPRVVKVRREMDEREQAGDATERADRRNHVRRTDRAAYFKRKLDERARSEDEANG
jgi:hypothetical protein